MTKELRDYVRSLLKEREAVLINRISIYNKLSNIIDSTKIKTLEKELQLNRKVQEEI